MPLELSQSRTYGVVSLIGPADWHMPAHVHEVHELILVRCGRLRVRIEGHQALLSPGQVIWYPAGVIHEEWCDTAAGLETAFWVFEWPQCARPPGQLDQRDAEGRIGLLAQWMLEGRATQHDRSDPQPHAFFHAVLSEFLRLGRKHADPLLERTRAYMRARLADALSLDDLAAQAHLSKYHFLRLYKAACGCTPMEDLRRMRLQRARELIFSTDRPMKRIAPEVGLGDEFQMSRLFRRHYGAPPSAYRSRRRG